jgi:hypothetical protein
MTLFEFTIAFVDKKGKIEDISNFNLQKRYVLANNEQEAETKLDNYRKDMIKEGMSDFIQIGCPIVDAENIIC